MAQEFFKLFEHLPPKRAMPKLNFGPISRDRAKCLFEVLLDCAEIPNLDRDLLELRPEWDNSPPRLIFTASRANLVELVRRHSYQDELTEEQISTALTGHLGEQFLGIAEDQRPIRHGQSFHFSLKLWSREKGENLLRFEEEWNRRLQEGASPASLPPDEDLPEPDNYSDSVPEYVTRPGLQNLCELLQQSGALIRITAPRLMGKTSLVRNILQDSSLKSFESVHLSFKLFQKSVLTSEKFPRLFCACVADNLNLDKRLDDFWDEDLTGNTNATNYFQRYLLNKINKPLILILDDMDAIFERSEIADSFCGLLLHWNDQARRGDRFSRLWQKLRLVIVHSTNIYGELDINTSPLSGVGEVFEIPEFELEEAHTLANRYQLSLESPDIEKLLALVGGHPFLLELAFRKLQQSTQSLEQILEEAFTETGVYRSHLREKLNAVRSAEKAELLIEAFKSVISTDEPVALDPILGFKLEGMALVKHSKCGKGFVVRCLLYQNYFQKHLLSDWSCLEGENS
ncbi:MAG: hypothetical protein F6K04_18870 [Leptolyngbya sp. SIO4C5]|nr:hypothetical protein [Leptolyngbya sp. SIO4C5]